jgi:excisionase family DNA binding protein
VSEFKGYLTSGEAARRLGVSLQRVQRLLLTGRIPEAKRFGGQWMIPERFSVTLKQHGPAAKFVQARRGRVVGEAPSLARAVKPKPVTQARPLVTKPQLRERVMPLPKVPDVIPGELWGDPHERP